MILLGDDDTNDEQCEKRQDGSSAAAESAPDPLTGPERGGDVCLCGKTKREHRDWLHCPIKFPEFTTFQPGGDASPSNMRRELIARLIIEQHAVTAEIDAITLDRCFAAIPESERDSTGFRVEELLEALLASRRAARGEQE